MSTLMSDIYPYEVLWDMALKYLAKVNVKLDDIINGDSESSAYLKEELKELPLYAIRGIYAVEQESMDTLIAMLNSQIENM